MTGEAEARDGARPEAIRPEASRPETPEGPLRRCLVTRAVRPKAELVRFVAGPEGSVVPDLAEALPGRGMWLSASRDVIHTACARNAFAKAAKRPLRPAPDLPDEVERLLVRRCIELIGLARRAGAAVGGFDKVSGRLASGSPGLLLQARDAAEDGRRKLRAQARNGPAPVPVVEALDAAELGRAFGDRSFVHVALDRGSLARRVMTETTRLAGLRGRPAEESEVS